MRPRPEVDNQFLRREIFHFLARIPENLPQGSPERVLLYDDVINLLFAKLAAHAIEAERNGRRAGHSMVRFSRFSVRSVPKPAWVASTDRGPTRAPKEKQFPIFRHEGE